MAALLVPPPAHAEPVALSADEYKKALRKVVLRIFEKSDLDKNGYITQDECASLLQNSLKTELEHTVSEVEEIMTKKHASHHMIALLVKNIRFTFQDLLASREALACKLFASLDDNLDGKVSKSEFLDKFFSEFSEMCYINLAPTVRRGSVNGRRGSKIADPNYILDRAGNTIDNS